MNLIIFEDEFTGDLYPFSLLRPNFDLKCGMISLKERILRELPVSNVVLWIRDHFVPVTKDDNPGFNVNQLFENEDDFIFINGTLLLKRGYKDIILNNGNTIFKNGDRILAVNIKYSDTRNLKDKLDKNRIIDSDSRILEDLAVKEVEFDYISYWWDLIHHNSGMLKEDFDFSNNAGTILGEVYPNVTLINEKNIYIGNGAKVKPGAVLDAEDGPVFIDDDAEIFPNAAVIGPAYIGKRTKIKAGAKIYEGTSIGEVCKVGGEVKDTIIHSYSNKQHDGFLGHAYLGQWVNLGADTNNSDLKNNYSNVKVDLNGRKIDTGSMFVGLAMGDHSKSGINAMFNTGTIAGICCNIYGAGLPPKHIPSFSWGSADGFVEYEIEKALQTERAVMQRRNIELSDNMEKLLRTIFNETEKDRR
ncbi:putative sugar nucleotidyl transferase [candidate division KSB1 bacterium]